MGICPICNGIHRHQIDVDLLNGDSLDEIMSRGYGKFSIDQLRVHAVTHVRVLGGNEGESIATRLAVREAEALSSTCAEYMATLKRLGETVENQIAAVENGEIPLSQALSKATVDLYLGAGNQIRETVKLLMEADRDSRAVDADSGNVSSLRKLTEAIDRSRKVV